MGRSGALETCERKPAPFLPIPSGNYTDISSSGPFPNCICFLPSTLRDGFPKHFNTDLTFLFFNFSLKCLIWFWPIYIMLTSMMLQTMLFVMSPMYSYSNEDSCSWYKMGPAICTSCLNLVELIWMIKTTKCLHSQMSISLLITKLLCYIFWPYIYEK